MPQFEIDCGLVVTSDPGSRMPSDLFFYNINLNGLLPCFPAFPSVNRINERFFQIPETIARSKCGYTGVFFE